MQTKREKLLIDILCENSPEVYTSKDLASLVNVSSRTVKTDLDRIKMKLEDIGAELKSKRGKGYWISTLDKEKITEALGHELMEDFPISTEDSKIIEFLLFRNKFLPVHEIAEKLYFSDSTLLRKIDEINKKLSTYDLQIIKEQGKGIKLIGEEKNQRLLYSTLLKEHNLGKDTSFQPLYIKGVLEGEDINDIHSALTEFQRKHEIGLSDIARTGLIIDVAVTLSRIKTKENLIINQKELEELKLNKEWFYALDLVSILKESFFEEEISESEVGFISIHLLSANLLNKEIPGSFEEIREQVDEKLLNNILDWIKKIDQQFKTNLHEDVDFVGSVALHIKPMLKRIEYGISLPNPWVGEFKNKYRKPYEMSVQLSYEIQKTIKQSITENEITYLAMHIGGALERFKEKQKIDVVIVCSSGVGISNFLKARLKRIYPEFTIKQTLSSASKELESIGDELVISTVPLEQEVNNSIRISPLLNEEDQAKIQEYIDKNKKSDFRKNFDESLFISNFRANSKVDVLKKASELLVSNGYADESFFDKVLERENLSSTEIGSLIAIPHAFNSQDIGKSGISVIILDEPITWDTVPVQLVFVLSIDANNTVDIVGFIEHVSEFSDNLSKVKEALDSKTYEEFQEIFY